MRPWVLAACLGVGAVLSSHPPEARAHSWYPFVCCSNSDCEAIPDGAVADTVTGYHVVYTSRRFGGIDEMIPHNLAKSSQDAQYHGCWRKKGIIPRSICFFAPFNA